MNDETTTIAVPLPDYIREMAEAAGEKAARTVIAEHIQTCAAPQQIRELAPKVERVQLTLAKLTGLLVGSGSVGAALIKWVFP